MRPELLVAASVLFHATCAAPQRHDPDAQVAALDPPVRGDTAQPPRDRAPPAGQPYRAHLPTSTRAAEAPHAVPAAVLAREDIRTESRRAALPLDYQTSIPEIPVPVDPARSPAGEAALYELQLGRLARRVVRVYQGEDGLLLVPVAKFLELAEISHQLSGGALSGRLDPDGERFRIDVDARQVRLGDRVSTAGPRDLTVVNREIYGSLALLSELFDLSATVDLEAAAVFVNNPERLPLARRVQREAARAILIGGERSPAPELILRGRGGWSGVVLAYQLRSSSRDPVAETGYDLGLATGAAAGSVFLRMHGAAEGTPRFEGAWTGIWPGGRWLTQLRLGDGVSTGPRPEGSRGVSVTNAPFARPVLVEDLPFAGTLPPDWSVEAYRAGRLVGFDSVGQSGRYLLTLPVQYGENPVDFVAYGPLGQVRTFNRTFRALPSMLPPGAFEYGVSAGQCRSSRCSAAGNLDLRYGLSRRWTIRGGVDRYWRNGAPGLSQPYASIVGAPTNPMGLELEGIARALVRVGLRIEPSLGLRVTADYVDFADGSSGSQFVPAGARRQWSLDGRVTPSPRTAALVVEAAGTRIETNDGSRTEARAGAAVRANNMLVRPYVRLDRSTRVGGQASERRYAGVETTVLPRRAFGPVLNGMWAQGRIEAEDGHRPTTAALALARNIGWAFRAEGGIRWERGSPGAVFTLSLVSQLDAIRATSLLTAPTNGGPARLDQSVGGSLVWSRNANVALSSEQALDRGGLSGLVFLDVNADGSRQTDEPVLPGTRVLVVNRWRTADAEGRYQVWGLSPYEEAIVSVDTTSLASPWWVPSFGSAAVLPAPNSFRTVDLPVVIGGIVEGSLLLDGQGSLAFERPLTVVLIETRTGARTEVETFSDASFYRSGLRPGHYAATVDSAALAPLRLAADTVRFTLAPSGGDAGLSREQRRQAALRAVGPTVSDLQIILRPTGSVPSPGAPR